jgi:hypothetical protein
MEEQRRLRLLSSDDFLSSDHKAFQARAKPEPRCALGGEGGWYCGSRTVKLMR